MQAHERVRLVPVSAGRMAPVDHDDLRAGRADQRIGEGHPGRATSDDEVVRLDGSAHFQPTFARISAASSAATR